MPATPARASAAPSIWRRGDHEVSLVRMYVLRAVFDGFLVTLPLLLAHSPGERGLFLGVKGGLWVMGLIGLRYPLGMLPVLLFELWWKMVWLGFIGLPQYCLGIGSPRLADDLFAAGLLPILLAPFLIPWGYVWRHYVRAPAERWR